MVTFRIFFFHRPKKPPLYGITSGFSTKIYSMTADHRALGDTRRCLRYYLNWVSYCSRLEPRPPGKTMKCCQMRCTWDLSSEQTVSSVCTKTELSKLSCADELPQLHTACRLFQQETLHSINAGRRQANKVGCFFAALFIKGTSHEIEMVPVSQHFPGPYNFLKTLHQYS
jgi:hypothetical protein